MQEPLLTNYEVSDKKALNKTQGPSECGTLCNPRKVIQRREGKRDVKKEAKREGKKEGREERRKERDRGREEREERNGKRKRENPNVLARATNNPGMLTPAWTQRFP